jgi:hypothetical protein
MTTVVRQNPYPGLRPFRESEAHLFFGRDTLIDEMLLRLGRSRFLGVVGSSGSGKSSLLRAGLIPRVRGDLAGETGGGWRVVTIRPWNDPIGRLAGELSRPGVLSVDSSDHSTPYIIETTLRRSSLGLLKLAARTLPADARLLLIVDQFEELFRTGSTFPATFGDDAAALVALLLEAVRVTSPVWVLIAMRSDFIGDCSRFHGLPELLSAHQYLVPRMTRDQLGEAIATPAAIASASVAPRLVQRLLNDVEATVDQLPILQHAMMRAWSAWASSGVERPIDIADYEAIGTVTDALSRHADQAFESLPEGRLRRLAERIFRALTDQPPHAQPVRRPLQFDRLVAEVGVEPSEALIVIESFRGGDRHFLVTSDDPVQPASVVDVSHESFIRLWGRLRSWLAVESESKRRYTELITAARRHAEGEASTWRDPELALVQRWIREDGADRHWAARYGSPADFQSAIEFVGASERAQMSERWKRRALWAAVPVALALALLVYVVGEYRRAADLAAQQRRFNAEVARIAAESGEALQKTLENQRITVRELEEARAALQPEGRGGAARPSPENIASATQTIDRVTKLLDPTADVLYSRQQDLARLERRAGGAVPIDSGSKKAGADTQPDSALRGYKVGIYFIAGHETAVRRANDIAARLRNTPGLTVQLYPRTQAFMAQVNPPKGDEIRYELTSEDERRAAEALNARAKELGLGPFSLRTVGTPTPGFISIVLADGVE